MMGNIFRGFIRATFIYGAIVIALILSILIELCIFIFGTLVGQFSEIRDSEGLDQYLNKALWFITIIAMVFFQKKLPIFLKNKIKLYQIDSYGNVANIEQLTFRSVLIGTYLIVFIEAIGSIDLSPNGNSLILPYFLLVLPFIQMIFAYGEFSLVDYILVTRATPLSSHKETVEYNREINLVLSVTASVAIAVGSARMTWDTTIVSWITSVIKSNPALVDAIVNADDKKQVHKKTTSIDLEIHRIISKSLDDIGLTLLMAVESGPALIKGRSGNPNVSVNQSFDIQIKVADFSINKVLPTFEKAANHVCPSLEQYKSIKYPAAINLYAYSAFGSYELNQQFSYVCEQRKPVTPMVGNILFGYSTR